MRHWLSILIAIAVGVPAAKADDFADTESITSEQALSSSDPGTPYTWEFGDGHSLPSVRFQVKPHGEWVKRFPLFKIEAPPMSSDCFGLSAEACFDSGKETGSAQIEFWADLSDGSHVVSKTAVPVGAEPQSVQAITTIGSNVWPVRCGADVVVTGNGTVRLAGIGIGQTGPAASPPVADAILSDEKILRSVTVNDLDQHLRSVGPISSNGGSRAVVRNWGFSELADGVGRSSFLVGNDVPSVKKVRLFNIDHPAATQGRLAVAGRVTQVATLQNARDGRSVSLLFGDFSFCRLELTLEPDTGPLITTSFRMSTDPDGLAPQLFRLVANVPAGRTIKRMSLDLVMPRGAIEFDGIDLVVPGSKRDDLPRVVQSRPPSDWLPVPIDDLTPLQIDPAIEQAYQTGQTEGPLQVQSESGNLSLNGDWHIEFKRAMLDGSPRRLTIVAQDVPMLKAGTFAVTGSVSYEGPTPGSDLTGPAWFELTTDYADGSSGVSGTTAEFGPAAKMTGHSTRRPFVVTATCAVQPVRFRLALVCGTGVVHLSPLSLVTYEPPPPVTQPAVAAVTATPSAPTPPPWWSLAKFTRPIGFTVVGLMVTAAAVFLVPGVAAQTWGLLMVLGLVAQAAFAWGMFLLGRGAVPFGVIPLLAAPLAWLLPAIARGLVSRRVRRRELRKMFTLDAVSG